MTPGTLGGRPDRPVHIVLVSDDEAVETALRKALEDVAGEIEVSVVAGKDAALEALPAVADGERFRTIPVALLDVDALVDECVGLLEVLKEDPKHRRLPALALARDPTDTDAEALYAVHANALVKRPDDPEEFAGLLADLLNFWLTVPALP